MEIRYLEDTDDIMILSHVYEESWKHAYRNIIPHEYLDSIPKGQWASHLRDDSRSNLVILEDGAMIGTSSFGKARSEEMKDYGEIISIYLLPQYERKGYGKQLMEIVIEELRKKGFSKVYLWVLEENHNARRFYEKAGFLKSNHFLVINIGGRDLKEVQYTKSFMQYGSSRQAIQYDREGKISKWLQLFLRNDGHNVLLADGLLKAPRYYYGVKKLPISILDSISQGAPDYLKGENDIRYFYEVVDAMKKDIPQWDIPPLIVEYSDHTFKVDDGRHRLEMFRQMNIQNVNMIVWTTGEQPDEDIVELIQKLEVKD